MKLFLTSSPIGIYRSEEPLNYKGFNPANGMVEELRRFWVSDSSRDLDLRNITYCRTITQSKMMS